jgi:hypothetical protein
VSSKPKNWYITYYWVSISPCSYTRRLFSFCCCCCSHTWIRTDHMPTAVIFFSTSWASKNLFLMMYSKTINFQASCN